MVFFFLTFARTECCTCGGYWFRFKFDPKTDCERVKALSLTVTNLLCYAFMPLLLGVPVNILPSSPSPTNVTVSGKSQLFYYSVCLFVYRLTNGNIALMV